jgi:hypothetical protein
MRPGDADHRGEEAGKSAFSDQSFPYRRRTEWLDHSVAVPVRARRRGAIGAFGANHHLGQSLVVLNVRAMQQPEA